MRKFLLIISLFFLSIPKVSATQDHCDKSPTDLLVDVGKVHEQCHKVVQSLEGYKYLWAWKWHGKSCTSHPDKCSTLTSLEKEFTYDDYRDHLLEAREYMDDTVVALNRKIRSGIGGKPLSKKFCNTVSLEIQGLAVGCKSIEKHLGERIHDIKEAYQAAF